jgi:multicomponent Na+:H+ antiporter subunit B
MRQGEQRVRLIVAIALVTAFAAWVSLTFLYSRPDPADSQRYLSQPITATGAANRVAGIYLNDRLLDTLIEILVFSVAVIGVRYYLSQSSGTDLPDLSESAVVRTAVFLLGPLALLVSTYFAVFGHISPGGGFAAGVIAASGLLYVAIAQGMRQTEARLRPRTMAAIEKGILFALLAWGLAPVFVGRTPFTDLLPKGTPGQILSGGSILIYNLLITAKVFLGSWVVIAAFAQHRGEL